MLLFDKGSGSFKLERISDTIHVKHRRPMKPAAEGKLGVREATPPPAAAAPLPATKSPTPPPAAMSLEDELAMSADEDDGE